ncbi:uncharacterized protein TNCV_4723351 [Trichonephila clavipes]|uniref:Uncharacterized protein n=1 Tax=Trichonephila clavipes TaxID=2585209 RepID=A0A8X7BG71_TRICX|nr:uncharacterized protein TNCV_4723351 [Trichonephila clavipes]
MSFPTFYVCDLNFGHECISLNLPCVLYNINDKALGSLVVRASNSRPEGLGSMPPNTLRVHSEYVLVKSVGPKVLWAEPRVQGTGKYFPPLQFHAKIVEVEIGGVVIYCPFGEFRRANLYSLLFGAQGLG